MLYLIISFALLLLSIYIGIEVSQVSNYVLITYNHWMIESSLWVALLVVLISFLVFYIALRFIGKSLRLAKQYRLWKKSYRERKAQILTQAGLCQLAEGQWQKAEEKLIKAAKISRKPLISYLGAATAANAQRAFDRREEYLRLAHNNDKPAAIAIGLTQAKLQLDSEQWEQGLSTLQHLNQLSPHHSHILKLLLEVNAKLGQCQACHQLLPLVKKYKALSKKSYEQYEYDIHLALLKEMVNKDLDSLQHFWQSLPKSQRDQEFTRLYVIGLLNYQQHDLAMQTVTSFLKKHWHQELLPLFAEIQANRSKQITIAENWLTQHPQDTKLLLCLGKLCISEQLWGKAKEYLLQSIQSRPSVSAYIELAMLYRTLNETDKIEACYRNALELSD